METTVYSELVRALLAKRDVNEPEAVEAFLNPDYNAHTHSPFLLEGMDRAVARVLFAIAGNERIAVYADFDCDGIPGAALLSDFFTKIGYGNFEVYLPHRDREGYGFHIDAISALAARNVALIITVDVGTTALDAVRHAKKLGVDVIVTDHHEIIGALPEAVAVLNPKLGSYPFRHLCGAGVAFKLAHALLLEGKKRGIPSFAPIPEGWEKWLLDLVAIATVADLVPLVGENRVLVSWGLKVLRKSPREGILALCRRLRLRRDELAEDDIGFSIAPRVNAASRMGEPDLALRLLTTRDTLEAETLAAHLEKLNASRKGVVASVVRQARKSVGLRFRAEDRVIVLGDPEWKPSLLGLAANSIMEERGGVVCLWGRDAVGNLKGSCRSDGSVSVVDLFANTTDAVIEYGGHAASGGFSVSQIQVHSLQEALASAAKGMEHTVPPAASGTPDARITLSEVSWLLFKDVTQLAPFGIGNPKPLFLISRPTISGVKRFGKEQNHVEVQLFCQTSGVSARAFDFFRSPDDFTLRPEAGISADILATIGRDTFRGGLALRIVDIMPV